MRIIDRDITQYEIDLEVVKTLLIGCEPSKEGFYKDLREAIKQAIKALKDIKDLYSDPRYQPLER
jgi:hypothetical protein